MRKIFLIITMLIFIASCNKPVPHNPSGNGLDNIDVPASFNWKTTKDIDVNILLPDELMRTKIISADGTDVYYIGYPTDTSTRVLNTKITIPTYVTSVRVTNGITRVDVDIDENNLYVDFNSINKNLKSTSDECGECDGQVTKLELEYLGGGSHDIMVTQKKGSNHDYVIFDEYDVDEPFEFDGANNHNKMGSNIKVYVDGVLNVEIHTSCSQTILVGMIFGDFEIISGESDNGGELCEISNPLEDDSYDGSLIFEDLYPSKGDYDFNDLVVDYNFNIVKDGTYVDYIDATFIIKAFGVSYHNSFGFQFADVNTEDINNVTGYVLKGGTIFDISTNGTENNQTKATIIVFDDTFDLMQSTGGIGVNTSPGYTYVTPDTIEMRITFESNSVTFEDLDIGNFNPFLVINQNRDYEVHLVDFEPTDLFDQSLFLTHDDNSQNGRYFLTVNRLPWAINIPENFNYVNEKVDISSGYLKFIEWAESDGISFPDWYQDEPGYRNSSNIYQIP